MGAPAPERVSVAANLPEGLTCRAQFLQVQQRGRRQHGCLLTLLRLAHGGPPDGGEGPARVGLTVSRRVGNAVVRNRVRRRLREIVRKLGPAWPPGIDHVLVAHPTAANAPFLALGEEVASLLRRAQSRQARGGAPHGDAHRGRRR